MRDHFLRFYYRFIVPQITAIERGYLDVAVKRIDEDLRAFMGLYEFEELCREWVWAAAARGSLISNPRLSVRIGAGGVQLDVVAVHQREKKRLIGEAKWGRGTLSRQVLTDLVKRSQRRPQVEKGWSVEYVFFAREKFSEAAQTTANEIGPRLVPRPEIEQMLVSANN